VADQTRVIASNRFADAGVEARAPDAAAPLSWSKRRIHPVYCLTDHATVSYDRPIIKTSRGTGPLKLEQPVA
jgi:hypothetical protein